MKAIVIGAGVGGPVTAIALRRAGVEVELCEARPGPEETRGLFLGLGINGMRVLRNLDLLGALADADTIPTPIMRFYSGSGKVLGEVPNGWLTPDQPSPTIMRGTLHSVLARAAADRGVDLRYGLRLAGYDETDGGVTARFDDGTRLEADILIGADGLWSTVRGAMGVEVRPSYTGLLNIGGVSATDLAETPGEQRMIWGRRAFFGYTVRSGGEVWWFANVARSREPARDELAGIDDAAWRSELLDLFSADDPVIRAILMSPGSIGAYAIHDLPPLPYWSRGRTALVGDAAHATSPSSGQGASMALEDAITIAKCVRDIADPRLALRRYEQLRRERAERIVAEGRRRGAYKAPSNALSLFLRDLLMPVGFKLFANASALSWIYDHDIPWETRVAPAGN